MAGFYITFGSFATTTAVKTAMKAIGAAAKQFEVLEVAMYGDGVTAPADIQHSCLVGFLSNAGAGTAGASPTPAKRGQGSNVSGITAGTKYSAEPTTYAANDFLFAFNQRGGQRWAVPPGQGFMTDGAQTNLSFGALVQSSAVGAVQGDMFWNE